MLRIEGRVRGKMDCAQGDGSVTRQAMTAGDSGSNSFSVTFHAASTMTDIDIGPLKTQKSEEHKEGGILGQWPTVVKKNKLVPVLN
jgi:hypothetical protein